VNPISHPGIELDIATSTVVIDGKRFPAVCILSQDGEGFWSGRSPRESPFWSLDIPLENGAIVSVSCDPKVDGGSNLVLHLHYPRWIIGPDGAYEQAFGAVHQGEIQPSGSLDLSGTWYWEDCDPEWIAEHLIRLSRMSARPCGGQPVKMVRLDRVFAE
jgi:hypothetical protein